MAEETQWEYHVVSVGSMWNVPKDEEVEVLLNELVEDGWDVTHVFAQYGSYKVRVIARRPLSESARRFRHWPK